MYNLKIENGFWWGAGSEKVYNWEKDGYHIYGVGVAKDILQRNNTIKLEIENKSYLLDCKVAREFINKYGSKKKIKGTWIGAVSKSLLTPILI